MSPRTPTFLDVLRLFTIIRRERPRFAVYSVANILAGSLGIFAPFAAGVYFSGQSAGATLTRVFRDGNGYTFAVALLATSAAFLLNDVLDSDRKGSSHVALRVIAGLLGVTLLLTLTLYSGIHFLAKVVETLPRVAVQTTVTGPWAQWTWQEGWQTFLVGITVLYGIWLFCLQHIEHDEEIAQLFRDERDDLVAKAGAAGTGSGIEA
jgi:hypothetical protein